MRIHPFALGALQLAALVGGCDRGYDADYYSSPTLSPDGQSIAFGYWHRGKSAVFEAGKDGRSARLITPPGLVSDNPRYSHDGTKIVFSVSSGKLRWDVYLLDRQTSTTIPLTSRPAEHCAAPVFSADDKLIYFARAGRYVELTSSRFPIGGWHDFDVYSMKLDGSGVTQITHAGLDWISGIAVSPDGNTLVIQAQRNSGLWMIDLNAGGKLTRLHPNVDLYLDEGRQKPVGEPEFRSPSYLPDGKSLLFSGPSAVKRRLEDGRDQWVIATELYRLNFDDPAEAVRSTNTKRTVWQPFLSYDGTELIFVSPPTPGRINSVWMMRPDGSGLRDITPQITTP